MPWRDRPMMAGAGALLIASVFGLSVSSSAADRPFPNKETLTYSIKKFLVKVGEATLVYNGPVRVDGREALSITFTAKGFNFFDEEQIYVDPLTFCPIVIKRDLNIFGQKERITEYYDADQGKVRIVKDADGKISEEVIEKGKPLDNIYGFLYRYRQLEQEDSDSVGATGRSPLLLHLPTMDVRFEVVKNMKFNAVGRQFDAAYLRSVPKKYEVWFDNSPQRIPLRIDGALGFGNLSMVMTGHQ